ncbi:hypothetical protein GA512_15515 [Bacillus paralicheniformis]|nr:hypothetical protein [Bacillus paralicheniformis]
MKNQKASEKNGCHGLLTKSPKRLLVLGFCHPFSVTRNPCSLGRRASELTFTGCDDGGVQAGRLSG